MADRPRRTPYFISEGASISGARLTLDAVDAHHLAVLRMRPGDPISVSDGAGRIFEARLEANDGRSAVAAIEGVHEEPPPTPRITVLQGLAKGSKIDWAVEKLVELGVDRIVVFGAGRSVPRWDAPKAQAGLARWMRVARAASKQSRRAWLPAIDGPISLEEASRLIAETPLALVADPSRERGLREALADEAPGEIALVVGPEGGLEPGEVEAFEAVGALAVGLGSQILRTETAGIALAAAVMFKIGRFG